MFDPISLSTLLSVGGSLFDAMGEREAAGWEAQQAEENKRRALKQGKQAGKQVRQEGRRAVGTQKAVTAGSGFMMSGTMLDALNESMREAEYDALATEDEYKTEAANYSNQSILAKQRQSSAMLKGLMGAGSALFGK
jgi:hypothetical protein